jgi:hypothetical protein
MRDECDTAELSGSLAMDRVSSVFEFRPSQYVKRIFSVEDTDFVAGFASWCGDTEATSGRTEKRMPSELY